MSTEKVPEGESYKVQQGFCFEVGDGVYNHKWILDPGAMHYFTKEERYLLKPELSDV